MKIDWGAVSVLVAIASFIVAVRQCQLAEQPPTAKTDKNITEQKVNNDSIQRQQEPQVQNLDPKKANLFSPTPKIENKISPITSSRSSNEEDRNNRLEDTPDIIIEEAKPVPPSGDVRCIYSDNEGDVQYFQGPVNHTQPKGWLKQGLKVMIVRVSLDKEMYQIQLSDNDTGWIPKEKIRHCN